jgi:hypothetical protein
MKGDFNMDHAHDQTKPGLINERDLCKLREAVCTQVEKVYDSCEEKDCIEDAKVLFRYPEKIQRIINKAINVKCNKAEVLYVYADIEPVPFKKGFYTVDVKYFIKVMLNFFVPDSGFKKKIITIPGLVLFDKKVVLFGSEGNVKIFKATYVRNGIDKPVDSALQQDNMPISKIEVAEPICLEAKIEDLLDKCYDECCFVNKVPRSVEESMDEEKEEDYRSIDAAGAEEVENAKIPRRRVVVTLGLFSIIKLVRYVQLLVPVFNFCVSNKKCTSSVDDNACDLFDNIEFPDDEFFPPQKFDFPGAEEQERAFQEKSESNE